VEGHRSLDILVVHDEELIRSGIAQVLSDAGDLRVESVRGVDAIPRIEHHDSDVVLLGARHLPDPHFAEVIRHCSRSDPRPVSVIAESDAIGLAREAVEMGASGALSLDMDPESLRAHVRSLAAGAVVLAWGRSSRSLFPDVSRTRRSAALDSLNPLQLQMLKGMAEGATNSDISRDLRVPLGTVKDSVSAILRTLGVTTRVEAVAVAARAGLPFAA
jgi:DNA-binding NarL/FixJ family response regulator